MVKDRSSHVELREWMRSESDVLVLVRFLAENDRTENGVEAQRILVEFDNPGSRASKLEPAPYKEELPHYDQLLIRMKLDDIYPTELIFGYGYETYMGRADEVRKKVAYLLHLRDLEGTGSRFNKINQVLEKIGYNSGRLDGMM